MKIFAKRTKKKAESSAPRTVNKSDPIVEELLKKDSSEWNAKERRMIKRYRGRKSTGSSEDVDTATTDEKEKTEDTTKDSEEVKDDVEQEENGNDDSSSNSDDISDDENENDKEDEKNDDDDNSSSDAAEHSIKKEVEKESVEQNDTTQLKKEVEKESVEQNDTTQLPKVDSPTAETEESNGAVAAEKTADDDGKVDKDHEIWSVLDKLNSKQKRTLARKLNRLGKSVLESVEQEANKILDEIIPVPVDSKRDQTEAASTDKNASTEPKKKKQKKAADWSSLPTEERLRREDQRKKQEEAAERKASGKAIKPGHKRPLNSERRRANRRKPKWGPKSPAGAPDISEYKNDHHSSGFLVRKNRGGEEKAMNGR